jgi:tRNA C32,U32 (ribose-2'-O)-methylase TrmJ
VSLRRALGRAQLEKRDVRTLHRILGVLAGRVSPRRHGDTEEDSERS